MTSQAASRQEATEMTPKGDHQQEKNPWQVDDVHGKAGMEVPRHLGHQDHYALLTLCRALARLEAMISQGVSGLSS
jgi:hypothetical protein